MRSTSRRSEPTPYRLVAAVEFAGGLALGCAARWVEDRDFADVMLMAALALMFFAGRNFQRSL